MTCDLSHWPPPPYCSRHPLCSSHMGLCCSSPLINTCSWWSYCLEYSLPGPLLGGWLLLKFRISARMPHPQRGLLWPPRPVLQHTPTGIPVRCFCLFVFSSASFVFQGQGQHLISYLCILVPRTKWFWIWFFLPIVSSSVSPGSTVMS